jgi:hypothetical protein
MIYHVLPGDSIADDFRKTGMGGSVIVCRECLIVGPVDAETPFEFWDERADFVLSEYGEDEIEFQERVADELERLSEIEDDDEVNLWFEYELFCQANMWFCLSLLAGKDATIYRVEPAVRTKDEIWQGFGSLGPKALRECFRKRTKFEDVDLELGRELWQAYRSSDHQRLEELGTSRSPCFPHLAEVVAAEVNKSTGPKQILREILAAGATDFAEIFAEFNRRAGVYGFGDLQVQRLLDRLY